MSQVALSAPSDVTSHPTHIDVPLGHNGVTWARASPGYEDDVVVTRSRCDAKWMLDHPRQISGGVTELPPTVSSTLRHHLQLQGLVVKDRPPAGIVGAA